MFVNHEDLAFVHENEQVKNTFCELSHCGAINVAVKEHRIGQKKIVSATKTLLFYHVMFKKTARCITLLI